MTDDPDDALQPDFKSWCKQQPCYLRGVDGAGPCIGGVDPDHMGLDKGDTPGPGLGLKADDRTCVPMCRGHHDDRHAGRGYFEGMSKDDKRVFRLAAISKTQAAYTRWVAFSASGWF